MSDCLFSKNILVCISLLTESPIPTHSNRVCQEFLSEVSMLFSEDSNVVDPTCEADSTE